jgi:hypothetical protein
LKGRTQVLSLESKPAKTQRCMIAARSSQALKEWAITIEFLKTGRQILLLRKGGIHEQCDGFRVEYKECFLLPTYLHENLHDLHPMTHLEFERLEAEKPSGNVIRFDTYAQINETIWVTNAEALRRLDGLHTLNWEAVERRFHYRSRPGLHLVLLRIYRLTTPHLVENQPEYDGCVSWVDLRDALPTRGAEPVLSPAEFEAQASDVRKLVNCE